MTLEARSTLPFFQTPLWSSRSVPGPGQRISAGFSLPGEYWQVSPRSGGRLAALKRLLEAAVHLAPGRIDMKHEKELSRQESTKVNKGQRKSAQVGRSRHYSTALGAACRECRQIIGEGHTYWNIKGCSRFAVSFRLNCLFFLRFAWHHFEQTVVPLWYHS
jgi:hypothetical protein